MGSKNQWEFCLVRLRHNFGLWLPSQHNGELLRRSAIGCERAEYWASQNGSEVNQRQFPGMFALKNSYHLESLKSGNAQYRGSLSHETQGVSCLSRRTLTKGSLVWVISFFKNAI